MAKIEEILGFTTQKGVDSEAVTRRYYVLEETPEAAKEAFQNHADGLNVPSGLELADVVLDEEKNANGLYYGTITFKNPTPKIKSKIAADLFETYGEKMTEGRKSGSHERFFRIKSDTAKQAINRLENYIRSTAQTSGRLHISDISVDESQDGDGYYSGHVVYNNPDTFGNHAKPAPTPHRLLRSSLQHAAASRGRRAGTEEADALGKDRQRLPVRDHAKEESPHDSQESVGIFFVLEGMRTSGKFITCFHIKACFPTSRKTAKRGGSRGRSGKEPTGAGSRPDGASLGFTGQAAEAGRSARRTGDLFLVHAPVLGKTENENLVLGKIAKMPSQE